MVKKKRIVDKKLLQEVSQLPCLVCGRGPSDSDHLKTRGAYGDDTENNVWSLCRKHHVERHKTGILTFVKKYPTCESWLLKHGREDILDKL